MTTVEILIAARKRIEKPENWAQHDMGRRNGERKTTYDHDFANCDRFCAIGAISAVTGLEAIAFYGSETIRHLSAACGGSVTGFNDTHTHAEVLAAFDRAIELARSTKGGDE